MLVIQDALNSALSVLINLLFAYLQPINQYSSLHMSIFCGKQAANSNTFLLADA